MEEKRFQKKREQMTDGEYFSLQKEMAEKAEALERKKQLELQIKIKKDAETVAQQMQASI